MIELPYTEVTRHISATEFLAGETGLSRNRIKDAMTKGAVWIETAGKRRRLRRASTRLNPGEWIALYYDEAILGMEPADPTPVADLGSCSVWIKPAGVLSSGTRFSDHCSIERIVEKRLDRPTFLVHRLDRFVSGLMVLAHSRRVAKQLSAQFESRSVSKVYQAIVHGQPADTTVELPVDDKPAVSHVTCLQVKESISLVEIRIETGRKHQIRKHLAALGHPIIGDRQYGSFVGVDLQLVSTQLAFDSPDTGERISFELPPEQLPDPEAIEEAISQDAN